jgi:uncharacterized protein (DUF697 family)
MEWVVLYALGGLALMWLVGRIPEKAGERIHKILWTVIGLAIAVFVVATCVQSVGRNANSDFERSYPR